MAASPKTEVSACKTFLARSQSVDMKALVVEDALGMRNIVCTMLKGMGYDEVEEAEDGAEGWRRLQAGDFDILLTDWNMPIMTGLELVKKVREQAEFAAMPIVMFTVRAEKQDVIEAMQAGVDAYVTKPFTAQELGEKIDGIRDRRSNLQVDQILGGRTTLTRDLDRPLVLFGVEVSGAAQLLQPGRTEIVRYLTLAVSTLDAVNQEAKEVDVGYLVESSTSDIARTVKSHGASIRLLMISPRIPGGGVTMARLISINKAVPFTIFMVCESAGEIPESARTGLDRLDIYVLERGRLDRDGFEQLYNEYVMAASLKDPPTRLPSPAEIRKRIERDIKTMVELPVLPQVFHQITSLDRDPDSELSDWIEAIEVDPLTRAQVIRRAHSPIYGFQGNVDQTDKAVILLGKNTVKEIVVSGALKKSLEGIQEEGFSVEDYWLHSVTVALAAKLLGFPFEESLWTPEQKKDFDEFQLDDETLVKLKELKLWEQFPLAYEQDPFVGGMMHDIGKAALSCGYPGLFQLLVETLKMKGWNVPMSVAEDEIAGGANHLMVGRILGENWKLGEGLCRIVERHHNPPPDDGFSQLIALADLVGGAISPFPQQALYPMVKLLKGDEAAGSKAKSAEGESSDEAAKSELAGGLEQMSPADALPQFLPEGLLEKLSLDVDGLVDLTRAVAPTVQQLTEQLKKSV